MESWVMAVWRKANPGLIPLVVGVVRVVLALACSGARWSGFKAKCDV